eukprot:8247651-Ditylum_brightwellii.AAC.1
MRKEIEKVQEERNINLMDTTQEMINEHTASTNEAIDKAVKDHGTMLQNMIITDRTHTDSKFDQVIQLLQAQMGSQATKNGTGSSLAVTEKNGSDYNQKESPDNVVSPKHQPCAESVGGAQQ